MWINQSHRLTRAQFEQNLHSKQNDPAFMDDIAPLLSAAVQYDSADAMHLVRARLIDHLPGEPWQGVQG